LRHRIECMYMFGRLAFSVAGTR